MHAEPALPARAENGEPQRRFAAPIPLSPSFCPLSMLFTDWNRSGTPSLRVANDREYYEGGQEQMWRILPGEPPHPYTDAEGWKYLRIWGMGIASYDLSGSGYPDYFVTTMADQKLQRVDRPGGAAPTKPGFTDIAYPKGVTAHRPYAGGDVRPSTGWHAQFEDVTNSGLVDLFITKGNVAEMKDFAAKDPNNLLMQRADGTFVEMGEKAGIVSFNQARGAALADFNLSGAIDILTVNRNAPAQLWRNDTPDLGHWVELQATQDGPNRNAIGGWIELRVGDRVQRRELTVGGGHASGQLTWNHFGLGDARQAEARVIWPDGTADDWRPVEGDAFYWVRRGVGPVRWTPGAGCTTALNCDLAIRWLIGLKPAEFFLCERSRGALPLAPTPVLWCSPLLTGADREGRQRVDCGRCRRLRFGEVSGLRGHRSNARLERAGPGRAAAERKPDRGDGINFASSLAKSEYTLTLCGLSELKARRARRGLRDKAKAQKEISYCGYARNPLISPIFGRIKSSEIRVFIWISLAGLG